MKAATTIVLLSAFLAPGLLAQAPNLSEDEIRAFNKQLRCDNVYVFISTNVAEKLLIHKVEPDACSHIAMETRVTGTVVIGYEIDTNGNVLHPIVISGPQILRKAVLDAVRKYKYKPYLLNGKTINVGTNISVALDNYHDCHYD
jgi:hypothetical protein